MASILKPHLARVSYRAGFARNAAESANPDLWDGLITTFVLGVVSETVPNFGTSSTPSLLHASNTDWVWLPDGRVSNSIATQDSVGYGYYQPYSSQMDQASSASLTAFCWAYRRDTAASQDQMFIVSNRFAGSSVS